MISQGFTNCLGSAAPCCASRRHTGCYEIVVACTTLMTHLKTGRLASAQTRKTYANVPRHQKFQMVTIWRSSLQIPPKKVPRMAPNCSSTWPLMELPAADAYGCGLWRLLCFIPDIHCRFLVVGIMPSRSRHYLENLTQEDWRRGAAPRSNPFILGSQTLYWWWWMTTGSYWLTKD